MRNVDPVTVEMAADQGWMTYGARSTARPSSLHHGSIANAPVAESCMTVPGNGYVCSAKRRPQASNSLFRTCHGARLDPISVGKPQSSLGSAYVLVLGKIQLQDIVLHHRQTVCSLSYPGKP